MAAPLVSGTAAFMISNDASLTPDQVKSRMMKTAWRGFNKSVDVYDDVTKATYHVTHDIFTIGAGLLDASAAFFNTDKPTGSAASPVAIFNTTTKQATINYNSTGATNVVWGDTGLFGSSVVWGTNVGGSNVVWGDNVAAGNNVVWGDRSAWSTSTAALSQSSAFVALGEN